MCVVKADFCFDIRTCFALFVVLSRCERVAVVVS